MTQGLIEVNKTIALNLTGIANNDEFVLLTHSEFPYADRRVNDSPVPMIIATSRDDPQERLCEGIISVADGHLLPPPYRFGPRTYGKDVSFIYVPIPTNIPFPTLAGSYLDKTRYNEFVVGANIIAKKLGELPEPYLVYHDWFERQVTRLMAKQIGGI